MIINSIDIMNGKAVQLKQGREKVLEENNPKTLVKRFDRYGEIAVIDIDAAFNKGNNEELIRELCIISNSRVGGGIRSVQKARRMFSYGADKIIIGTAAFKGKGTNAEFLSELCSAIGRENVIIALDSYEKHIVIKGWTEKTGISPINIISQLEQFCSEFLLTVVEKEGLMQGTDWEFVEKVNKMTTHPLTVAGGISTLSEIKKARELDVHVQLGMAVYRHIIDLDDAFIESIKWDDSSLVPTMVEDENGQILMLAYSNRESVKTALSSGRMTYFSRSRQCLWHKGETSGNFQELLRLRLDCDRDTIKATVKQRGNACHLNRYSCFGSRKFSLEQLLEVLKERIKKPLEKSYTASLTPELLREKIMEEAEEVCIAETRSNKIWELADILYFLEVFMAQENISIQEVINELQRRRIK